MRAFQRPVLRRSSFTASASAGTFVPKSTYSWEASASTRTASSLRLSPRTTLFTVPLTGEVTRIWGFCLSARTGEPARTRSPSFTRSLGRKPLKSVGLTATTPGLTVFATFWAAAPFTGMSRPFFKSSWLDIIAVKLSLLNIMCEFTHFFAIFVKSFGSYECDTRGFEQGAEASG